MPPAPTEVPIFVVGHARSGTTLLRLILNAHPRIVVPPEAHLVSFLRRCEGKYGPLTDPASFEAVLDRLVGKRGMREWNFEPDVMRECCRAGEHTPAGVFASLMGLWTEREDKPRWGEKTPGTYRFLPDVDAWFPGCQVLHIIRDARDVAVSCLTPPFADLHDKGNEYEVALRWRDAIRRGRRAARNLGPRRYLEFRYEDLTADAEAVVHRICEFLHEDFVPEMLEFHKGAMRELPRGQQALHPRTKTEVNQGRIERWRRDASQELVMRVEGIAGKELTELGYALSGYKPSAALRAEILYQRMRPRRLIKHYRPHCKAARSRRPGSS